MTKTEKGCFALVASLIVVPCLLYFVINMSLTDFYLKRWSPRLRAGGWSRLSQPIFLASIPQGITMGGKGGFVPSSYAIRMVGPTMKARKFNLSALGRLDSIEVIDEDNLFVLVEVTVEGPEKPGFTNLYTARHAYRFNVRTERAEFLFAAGEPGDHGNAIASVAVSNDFALGVVARRMGVDVIDIVKRERKNFIPYCKVLLVRLSPDKKQFAAYVCIEESESSIFTEEERSNLRGPIKHLDRNDSGKPRTCYYGLIKVDIETGKIVEVRPAEAFGYQCVSDQWFEASFNPGKGRGPEGSEILFNPATRELVTEQVARYLPERCFSCSYSPDGKYLGFFTMPGVDNEVSWRDSSTGSVAGSFNLEGGRSPGQSAVRINSNP